MTSTGKRKVRFSKILLPFDSSKLGEAALSCIEELAIKTKSEVVLSPLVRASAYLMTKELI